MDFLIDPTIYADYLIQERDNHPLAKKIIGYLKEKGHRIWISASSVDTLKMTILKDSEKYKLDKRGVLDDFKQLVNEMSIVTVVGKTVKDIIEEEDIDFALAYRNFKRIAKEGLVISNTEISNGYNDVISTVKFEKDYLNSNSNNKTSSIALLDLQDEYRHMLEDIDNAVLNAISDAKYILGPQVKALEELIASYLGVKHCVAVSSGTEALVIALRALAIKLKGTEYWNKEDLILTTPFTFTATGDAILRSGATPVFIDVDLSTYNIDVNKVKQILTDQAFRFKDNVRIVGILPVHLYGQSCDMDKIMDLATEYDLFVVEDVAQAFGGKWREKRLGSIGTVGAFSFFPSKNLGGFGDGGMLSTDDDEIADLARMLLRHGGRDKYNVDHIGYNARLDTLQAAILLEKMRYIDKFNKKRRQIAHLYTTELEDVDFLIPPREDVRTYHVYHQYTVNVLNGHRDILKDHLKNNGIASMVYYPVPLHKMKVFSNGRSIIYDDLKNAEEAVKSVLSLPIEPLQQKLITYKIIETIKKMRDTI